MFKKISFISIGSLTMLCCMMVSVATFAGNKNKQLKKQITTVEEPLQTRCSIAELFINMNYAYVPYNNNSTLNTAFIGSEDSTINMVTKDDYHYYFKKQSNGFHFLYAVKDNNIPLFDGFEYASETKIPIGTQLFIFDMMNGRPIDMLNEPLNTNSNFANIDM